MLTANHLRTIGFAAHSVPMGRARAYSNTGQTVSFEQVIRRFATVTVLALASVPDLGAQVGLSSGIAQVGLVARIAPRAAIQQVSPGIETGRHGAGKELSVSVRLLANTGYRLVVVGTETTTGSRLWVRGADGEFQEIRSGTAVTVVRDARSAGEWEREVGFRTEGGTVDGAGDPLPVRYEMVINPTI